MNNPKSLKITITIIVIILFEIIICILYYFGFVDIRDKNNNIAISKKDILLQNENEQYMLSMEKMISNADSNIISVNNSIIQKDEDVKFIEIIEDIARANNLSIKIDSLFLEKNQNLDSNGLTILKIKASVGGSWVGMYSFLFQIESLPLKVKIDKFYLVNGSKQAETQNDIPKISNEKWNGVFELGVLKYK